MLRMFGTWPGVANARAVTILVIALAIRSNAFADQPGYDRNGVPSDSIATSLPDNGDPSGIRRELAAKDIYYGFNYIGELWHGAGGIRQGGVADGRLEFVLDINLETLMGFQGLRFHTNVYDIQGGSPGRQFAGNLFGVSSIEGLPALRLSEVWLEQEFLNKTVTVRAGQLAADQEFITSIFAGSSVSPTFGWPGQTAVDLPSGGPAYPLATPGVRLKITPNDNWTGLLAVFNGDPSGPGEDNSQARNRGGVAFRVNDDPFVMGEVQYKYNQGEKDPGLAGTLKFGGWQHSGDFTEQRFGTRVRGNSGIYGVIDQQLYRPPGTPADGGIGVFARVLASPEKQNLIDFYVDAGIVFAGLIPSRPADRILVSAAYGHVSSRARDADRDAIDGGAIQPVRDYEAIAELSYQAQIMEGWLVQPDLQYVWHPGGNVPDPRDGASANAVKDSIFLGLRTVVKY